MVDMDTTMHTDLDDCETSPKLQMTMGALTNVLNVQVAC
jgi:hypothetical protein